MFLSLNHMCLNRVHFLAFIDRFKENPTLGPTITNLIRVFYGKVWISSFFSSFLTKIPTSTPNTYHSPPLLKYENSLHLSLHGQALPPYFFFVFWVLFWVDFDLDLWWVFRCVWLVCFGLISFYSSSFSSSFSRLKRLKKRERERERERVKGREWGEKGERKKFKMFWLNIHDYCSNFGYEKCYRNTDVGRFWAKNCVKWCTFSIIVGLVRVLLYSKFKKWYCNESIKVIFLKKITKLLDSKHPTQGAWVVENCQLLLSFTDSIA